MAPLTGEDQDRAADAAGSVPENMGRSEAAGHDLLRRRLLVRQLLMDAR
jgi:hypothetical protein